MSPVLLPSKYHSVNHDPIFPHQNIYNVTSTQSVTYWLRTEYGRIQNTQFIRPAPTSPCTRFQATWRTLPVSTAGSRMSVAPSPPCASTRALCRTVTVDSRAGKASCSRAQLDAAPLHSSSLSLTLHQTVISCTLITRCESQPPHCRVQFWASC